MTLFLKRRQPMTGRRTLGLTGLFALALTTAAGAQDMVPAPDAPSRAFEREARLGMAYRVFRTKVSEAGWKADGADDCAEAAGADLCKSLPELDRCASDGLCLMTFSHPDEDTVLRIATRGDLRRWAEGRSVTLDAWGYE